jgi:hypothetical protein
VEVGLTVSGQVGRLHGLGQFVADGPGFAPMPRHGANVLGGDWGASARWGASEVVGCCSEFDCVFCLVCVSL